ncbi:hypothetical protein [Paracidovorax konjaci]|uniref:Uncharacterized protein n=1 Tax=Paracidovorax konjaci TaxID=32040 RepID=A0A1I1XAJ7_9BURK|nr:hypothetical protein [Paracidovorax konjaci]SFE02753.1 hypothetical protein SAMN04489710_1126 [Paracidovorax konjaci]
MPSTPRKPASDEPEVTQENDVPLDGTDPDGEAMMKEVRNDRLEVPPGEEEKDEGKKQQQQQ